MSEREKILVFMKPHYTDIEAFLRANFDCTIFKGDWGDPLPNLNWEYIDDGSGRKYNLSKSYKYNFDWIFSFLCPWKLPKEVLKCAKKGAINFHPGPPKYPGIGCYNYAIWNEDEEYGVTCHYMDEKLDNGKIIRVYPVDIYETDTIETLKNRSIVILKTLFYSIIWAILNNNGFVTEYNGEWGEYKNKKNFREFCNINQYILDPLIQEDDLELKLRATYYPGASEGPYIIVNGKKWRLVPY